MSQKAKINKRERDNKQIKVFFSFICFLTMAEFTSDELLDQLLNAIGADGVQEAKALLENEILTARILNVPFYWYMRLCECRSPKMLRVFLDSKVYTAFENVPVLTLFYGLYRTMGTPAAFKMLVDEPCIDINAICGDRTIFYHISYANCALQNTKVLLACERLKLETLTKKMDDGLTSMQHMHTTLEAETPDLLHAIGLTEAFVKDPVAVRGQLRCELGYPEYAAAELFATIVLVCDEYYEIKE